MSQDTTQAKFRKSPKKDSEQPQIEENEVRIKGNMGNVKRYVDYACGLLQKDEQREKKEDKDDAENNENNENKDDKKAEEKESKTFKTIVLKATGRAINKAVTTAEVVKRRIAGLHQDTKLETLEIVDVWEPTEEGLKTVETTRRVASITIKLSLDEEEIEKMKKNTGYQPPLAADSVTPIKASDYPVRSRNTRPNNYNYNYNRRGRRGGRRGGYNRNYGGGYYGGNRYGRGGYNRSYGRGGYGGRGSYGSRYRGSSNYNRSYNRY